MMRIEITTEDADLLRGLLQDKVTELDREINRTDSLQFKKELQQVERRIERIIGQISADLVEGA
jgi:hypothetical protein